MMCIASVDIIPTKSIERPPNLPFDPNYGKVIPERCACIGAVILYNDRILKRVALLDVIKLVSGALMMKC